MTSPDRPANDGPGDNPGVPPLPPKSPPEPPWPGSLPASPTPGNTDPGNTTPASPTPGIGIHAMGLRRAFGPVLAVDHVDLVARAGAVTALIGPNGSGKTTLLLMLAGLLRPDAGQSRVAGFDPVTQSREVRSRMGWMPDTFGTWESLTAREVLVTVGAAYRLRPEDARRRAADLLATVHLLDLADAPAHVLSRGQKQRLGLARALVHDPDVLLLDEPANGLDPRSRVDLRHLLRGLAAAGKTVLVSSHVLAELDEMADDAVFLSRGRTVIADSVAAVETRPRPWRLAALDPDALAAWLTGARVGFEATGDGAFHVTLDGDASAAALLRDAVGAGVAISSLAPAGGALEQAYLALDEERL